MKIARALLAGGILILLAALVIHGQGNGRNYTNPDTPPTNPTSYDCEFNGTTCSSNFAWVNQLTGGTVTTTAGWLQLTQTSVNSSANGYQLWVESLPSAPFTFVAKTSCTVFGANYGECMPLLLRESSSGKFLGFATQYNAGLCPYGMSLDLKALTSPTSASTDIALSASESCLAFLSMAPGAMYYKIAQSGSTLNFSVSADGVNYIQEHTEAETTHFTTAPNQIGFATNPYSQIEALGADYIRRTQ